jgi:hypothetical protein
MTTRTEPHTGGFRTRGWSGGRTANERLEIWGAAEPPLGAFGSVEELAIHLADAASSRAPDLPLTSMGFILVADPTADLAKDLYFGAFEAGLWRIATGVRQRYGADLALAYEAAEDELGEVTRECLLAGETLTGATILSRTWARTFLVYQVEPRSRLRAEAEALVARWRLFVQDARRALAERGVRDRLAGRMCPMNEVAGIAAAAGRVGPEFADQCDERRLPAWAARRQGATYLARRPYHAAEIALITEEIDGLVLQHFLDFGEDGDTEEEQ